jgi:hypothetical protein
VINVAFEAENTEYTVTLTDMQGRVVFSEVYSNLSGAQQLTIPVDQLQAGSYMINLGKNGESFSSLVMVK